MKTTTRPFAPRLCAAALLACTAGLACPAAAQQSFIDYTGPDGGFWNAPGNWEAFNDPGDAAGEVPMIQGGFGVLLNMHATVDKIGLDPGAQITVLNNNLLGVRTMNDGVGTTGLFGGGTIVLDSTGHGTYLRITGDPGSWAIFGHINEPDPSHIFMSNTTANIIDASTAGVILYNEGLIDGAGTVGANTLRIINNGTIAATTSAGITLDPPAQGMENNGLLYANGGPLTLINGVLDNQDGEFQLSDAPGSRVDFSGAVVIGGTLRALNTTNPFRGFANSEFRGCTVWGQFRILNNNLVFLTNDTPILDGGSIHLDSTGHGTYARITNNLTLSGAGAIYATNTQANIIDGSTPDLVLTNNLAGGINGSMALGANSLRVVNNSIIRAQGSGGITIDPPASGFANNGQVLATTGSSVTLINGTISNNGTIAAQAGASITFSGASVQQGTLHTETGGSILGTGNTLFNTVTTTPTTQFTVPNNNLCFFQGTITNHGTLTLNSTGHGTYFRSAGGDVVLNGPGVLSASNTTANFIDAQALGQRLINNSTIRGSLSLGANTLIIENNGLIEATGSGGISFDIPAGGSVNNATLRAAPGSSFTIFNGALDNTDGVIEAAGSVVISGATIAGGTLRSTGGAFSAQANSLLSALALDGLLTVPNNNLIYLRGTIANTGQITLASTGHGTYLRTLDADAVLQGGEVVGTNTTANIIDATTLGQRLTNNGTIRGAMSLGANSLIVVNNGLVRAEGGGGIHIDPPTGGFDNNGTMRSTAGSSFFVINGTLDNTGGLIDVLADSSFTLQSATLTGGTVQSTGTGIVRATGNSILRDLTNNATTTVPNIHLAYLQGSIVNNGQLNLASTGNATYFRTLGGNATVSGSGTWNFSNTTANLIDATSLGESLTIVGNTLRGSVSLGANNLIVINRGTIIADQSGGILIDPPAATGFVNDTGGTLAAEAAGSITIAAGPFTNAGTLRADPGRLINRTAGDIIQTAGITLAHGEVQADGVFQLQGGTVAGTGRVDADVNNTGGTVAPGASAGNLIIEGSYTQAAGGSMEIELGGPVPAEFDHLLVTVNASLNGTIVARFTNGYAPEPGTTFRFLDTGGTRTGTFTTITTADAPPGLGVEVVYHANGASLVVIATCGSADFDGDGDVGTDADIEAFFACLAGNCCSTCYSGGADFNGDGDVGTDADIESFFRVLSGGNC